MIEPLIFQYDRNLDYARRLVAGLDEAQACAQPPGLTLNHATWVIGHLAVVADLYAEVLGLTREKQAWMPLFGGGSTPGPDPRAYPPLAELFTALEHGHDRLKSAVRAKPADYWTRPPEDEKRRSRWPTMGEALVHIMVNHEAVHLGQLSAWRRAMGLKPV